MLSLGCWSLTNMWAARISRKQISVRLYFTANDDGIWVEHGEMLVRMDG